MRDDERIERNASISAHGEWVDVEFGNEIADIVGEVGQRDQCRCNRFLVCSRTTAHTIENRRDREFVDHAPSNRRVDRDQPELTVAEHLDEHTTTRHENHRPELRVGHDAKRHLYVGNDHRSNEHCVAEPVAQVGVGLTHAISVDEVQHHAADIGFVQDPVDRRLQHDGIADLVGCGNRRVDVVSNGVRHHGHAVVRQEIEAF